MQYTFSRSDRVAEELQRQISTIIQRKIADPRLKLLSITGVKLSPDLKNATIYYSLGGEDHAAAAIALKKAAIAIRSMLTDRVVLRRIPALNFVFDESQEGAHRISSLLNELEVQEDNDLAQESSGEVEA